MIEALRQLGLSTNFMTAYDLFFRQSSFNRWVMQTQGAFSVDRENFNSQPIKEAIHTLLDSKFHLTIFSEGRAYLQNDLITNFQPGGAFIAHSAQKAMEAKGEGQRVFLVPTAMKLTHAEDCRSTILDLLRGLYDFLGLTFDANERMAEAVERAALALMDYGLQSLGYPPSKGKTLGERQQSSGETVIRSLEEEMSIVPGEAATLNERCLYIRNEIHKVMLSRNGNSKLWAHSRIRAQKVMLAMKILSYPVDYLRDKPTLDRCGEMVERLIEDRRSKAIPPYGKRRAIIQFGKPYPLSDRDPDGNLSRNELLSVTTAHNRKAIQDLLDQINLTNDHEGGRLF